MKKHDFSDSLLYCIKMLRTQNVIAYPTESMFGLGCDPDSEKAVKKLLFLKKRSIEKGFILVAASFHQIRIYINEKKISEDQRKKMFFHWPGPFTFLLPANSKVPFWLTGKFKTLAIRITAHADIIRLCNAFGKAIISTSANITNMTPSITREAVFKYFGRDFPVLNGKIGNDKYPSKIIDIINGTSIRYV